MVDALSLMVSNCVQGMIMERFEVGKNQVTLPISIWRMIVYPFVRSSLDNDLIKYGEDKVKEISFLEESLKKLMRDFLWEGVEEGKRADLLNWEASCKLIYIGRLRLGALGLIIGCYWQNGYGVFPLSPLLFGLVVSDYHKQCVVGNGSHARMVVFIQALQNDSRKEESLKWKKRNTRKGQSPSNDNGISDV
ncbi:hypothetical protein E5676_scaffold602G00580 [Cucumis melo var. makuwa]|nr:hypothetical protein E5676_scaffold602G00580 [Cucumis melo var. makuwa]